MTISGWSKTGREEEGSGDSEQDVVGSAGILAEPIRLRSHYQYVICYMIFASIM